MNKPLKIKTAKDVEALDLKIKSELGVDVGKYRKPEVAEAFVDLLIFPRFVITWILRPIIISLLLYIALFFAVDFSAVAVTFYTPFGLLLFLLNGIVYGVIFVMWKLKSDIYSIIEYSLGILKNSVTDLQHIGKTTVHNNKKETLGLLFLGITHIVTIPMVTTALSNKIPLVGGLISGIIKRKLRLVASTIKFDYKDGILPRSIVSFH